MYTVNYYFSHREDFSVISYLHVLCAKMHSTNIATPYSDLVYCSQLCHVIGIIYIDLFKT